MKKVANKGKKQFLSHEKIYRIMQWLPILVCGLFFVKNVAAGESVAMIAIGIILAVFVGVLVIVSVKKMSFYVKEFVLALALPVMVFSVSLFSGASYSDDFPLFLAVIALTGVFLEPKFTRVQIVLSDILLAIMYVVHPEKAGERSQYILCVAVFTLAAFLNYILIKRGQAFIQMSEERAAESERLLESMRAMGVELQQDFEVSSAKIEESTAGLKMGSVSIAKGSGEVSDSCDMVREKVKETEEQIERLNDDVRAFEAVLTDNQNNIEAMNSQVETVGGLIRESGSMFRSMEEQMQEIAGIARQINDIAFKLTILSVNATVEAAHAGEYGAGFEVLAMEMRALSENSGVFTEQVSDTVKGMLKSVALTSERFAGSEEALKESEETMRKLILSFNRLDEQFEMLYGNIEQQNDNVNQIDRIFDNLNYRVAQMHCGSTDNQRAVEEIVEAMADYRKSVGKIVENTQSI